MELFSSDSSQLIILNITRNLSIEVPYFTSHNLKYGTRYREKKRFGKASEFIIEGIDVSVEINALFTDKRVLDWIGDSMTVSIYYYNDETNIPTSIYKVRIENPSINGEENGLLKISFQLNGSLENS